MGYVNYTLQGPDNRGHGKNWTIGKLPHKECHAENNASPGDQFTVLLRLDGEGCPRKVTWKRDEHPIDLNRVSADPAEDAKLRELREARKQKVAKEVALKKKPKMTKLSVSEGEQK